MSIGSLYQYFPSKEALVAAVIDRHHQELMQVVRGALAESALLPMEQAVRKLVAVGIKAHSIDPKLQPEAAAKHGRQVRTDKGRAVRSPEFGKIISASTH